MDYITKIKNSGNCTAVAIKLADLQHNFDISRIDVIDEKATARVERYNKAIEILEANNL